RRGPKLPGAQLGQLLVICLLVVVPVNYVLHERHTVGPAAYTFTDVDGYVADTDGARSTSTADAAAAWVRLKHGGAPMPNLVQFNWGFRASFNQNLDLTPLE